ncbi:metallophosphoesterase family protein [Rhodopirellula sp. SWK7]|uniref:metallophosphoesterase family protein n=1 Tax=Rhodopirellula sp. SWK7 TaxID=595460 RepID=UPI0002BE73F8|nr:metallophosphoesterase family protein [Rhodopirellula sp. SWK7]EMI44775.1 serine/threonine protein phosphatase [Rhodopirellula sp. SWK7]
MARFVIGDVHGCGKALRSLLTALSLGSEDEVILVGDYVDRGPNSRDVIEQLIQLSQTCRVIALRGNHEVMLQGVVMSDLNDETWMRSGGKATVTSYGGSATKIPSSHLDFFRDLHRFHETDTEIFVHAMYNPLQNIADQNDELTYWAHLPNPVPMPHVSGKRVYLGHTPQPSGEILCHAHLVGVDTYCFGGGYLTAVNLETHSVTQADRHGHVRRVPIEHLLHALTGCIRWLRKKDPNNNR